MHVIVKRCYDFSRLLRSLTPANNENLPSLTFAYPGDPDNYRDFPPPQNKRTQLREVAQEKIFTGAGNFR